MSWTYSTITLQKRYPLRISGAVFTESTNCLVMLTRNGMNGIGEVAPAPHLGWTFEACERDVRRALPLLEHFTADDAGAIQAMLAQAGIIPPVCAGIDHAFWDLRAKQAKMPLRYYLALPQPAAVSSVTIGMETPAVLAERVPEILTRTTGRALKVKLGHADGIAADQEIYSTVATAASPFGVPIRVDANGGWNLDDARRMCIWLKERGAEYVEQPMPRDLDDAMTALFADRPLPLFIDESVYDSKDIVRMATCVDGINLKLMKCGGITEALRMVAVARALDLQTMIGCMGESSIGIAAGASISGLFDFIDLDSQLNLLPDPGAGVEMRDGIVYPADTAGHGGRLNDGAAG